MNHSEIAIQTAEGSTWDLDRFAQEHNWEGVGIIFTHHRDSDPFNKSNWDVISNEIAKVFGTAIPFGYDFPKDISFAWFNHWAVGWMEHMCFNTARKDIAVYVEEIHKQLQNYPLLDEIHYMDNYEKEEDAEIQQTSL